MKMIIAFAALVAIAVAAPAGQPEAVIVKETPLDNIGVDGYGFGYELSDGSSRQESAQLINAGTENEALVITGSYSWVDPVTNQKYTVEFTADQDGFHPRGAHLPA